jgi:hypothetical protein
MDRRDAMSPLLTNHGIARGRAARWSISGPIIQHRDRVKARGQASKEGIWPPPGGSGNLTSLQSELFRRHLVLGSEVSQSHVENSIPPAALGIVLPPATGARRPVRSGRSQAGDLLFLSGLAPLQQPAGKPITGKVGADFTAEEAQGHLHGWWASTCSPSCRLN